MGRVALRALAAIILALAQAGCFLLPEEEQVLQPPITKSVQVSYNVLEVTRGTIIREAKMMGHLIPLSTFEISFNERGKLTDIYVVDRKKVEKGEVLASLNLGTFPRQLEQKKVSLEKTRLQMELKKLRGVNRFEMALASLDVKLAELDVRQVEGEMDGLRLVSPISGIALLVGKPVEGDTVEAYAPLVTVVDPSMLVLECEQGTETEFFTVGKKVEVRIRGVLIEGKIAKVPQNVLATLMSGAPKEKILVSVPEIPPVAQMGDIAIVSILIEKSENTVVLPKSVVHSYGGRWYVNLLNDKNLKEERYVSLGIETTNQVEIVEGLEEGELVIVN